MSSIEGVLANIAVARLSTSLCVGRCGRCRFAKTFAGAMLGFGELFSQRRQAWAVKCRPIASAMWSGSKLSASCAAARLRPENPAGARCAALPPAAISNPHRGARFQDFGSHLWGDLLYFK